MPTQYRPVLKGFETFFAAGTICAQSSYAVPPRFEGV